MKKITYFLSDDVVFKIFFTNNRTMLKKLISMSLKIDEGKLKNMTLINPNILSERKNEKIGILDLLIELDTKEKINIEIQNSNNNNFPERIEFYLSKLFTQNLKESDDYKKLNKVCGIYLLNYNDKNYDNFYTRIVDYDIMNKKTTKSIKEKVVYNLTKIDQIDKYGFSEEEKNILKLIKCKDERELREMAKTDKTIEEALKQLEEINADKELVMILNYIEKQRLDENSAKNHAKMVQEELDEMNKKMDATSKKLIDTAKERDEALSKLKAKEQLINNLLKKLEQKEKEFNFINS